MADYPIIITEQDILDASTYVSIGVKEYYTRKVAPWCTELVEVKNGGDPLPTMFRENKKIKAQYLMGALATLLGKQFNSQKLQSGEELTGCMDENDYDMWAQSYVMNQLERLKKCKNTSVVNRLFDLLYEYKAIELMLTGAIRDELEMLNDVLNRAIRYFTVSAVDAGIKDLALQAVSELRKDGGAEANG